VQTVGTFVTIRGLNEFINLTVYGENREYANVISKLIENYSSFSYYVYFFKLVKSLYFIVRILFLL